MIALTTPTGTNGSKVLRNLVEAGTSVRVLARSRSRLPEDLVSKIEVVEGSLDEPGDLDRLFAGAEAAFWCQPDANTASDYLAAYDELAGKGRDALGRAGVARVVAISAAGEPSERPAGPITGLHRMEKTIAESGAACRFLRCGSFMDNLLWQWDSIVEQGVFVYPMDGDVRAPHVSAADIARVAAQWLSRPDWSGCEAIQVAGPEDLSYNEMAAILSRELDRSVVFENMEPAAYRDVLVSLGTSAAAAKGLTDMFAYLEGGYQIPPEATRASTPTTLVDWLRREG